MYGSVRVFFYQKQGLTLAPGEDKKEGKGKGMTQTFTVTKKKAKKKKRKKKNPDFPPPFFLLLPPFLFS